MTNERFHEAWRCVSEGHVQGPDWGCSASGTVDVWCGRCDAMYQIPFEQLDRKAQKWVIDVFVPGGEGVDPDEQNA